MKKRLGLLLSFLMVFVSALLANVASSWAIGSIDLENAHQEVSIGLSFDVKGHAYADSSQYGTYYDDDSGTLQLSFDNQSGMTIEGGSKIEGKFYNRVQFSCCDLSVFDFSNAYSNNGSKIIELSSTVEGKYIYYQFSIDSLAPGRTVFTIPFVEDRSNSSSYSEHVVYDTPSLIYGRTNTLTMVPRVGDSWKGVQSDETCVHGFRYYELEDSHEPGEPSIPEEPLMPLLFVDKHPMITNALKFGDTFSYVVTVTNTGNVTIKNIILEDSLVTIDAIIASLEPGEFKTITYEYTLIRDDIFVIGEKNLVRNIVTATGTALGGDEVYGSAICDIEVVESEGSHESEEPVIPEEITFPEEDEDIVSEGPDESSKPDDPVSFEESEELDTVIPSLLPIDEEEQCEDGIEEIEDDSVIAEEISPMGDSLRFKVLMALLVATLLGLGVFTILRFHR